MRAPRLLALDASRIFTATGVSLQCARYTFGQDGRAAMAESVYCLHPLQAVRRNTSLSHLPKAACPTGPLEPDVLKLQLPLRQRARGDAGAPAAVAGCAGGGAASGRRRAQGGLPPNAALPPQRGQVCGYVAEDGVLCKGAMPAGVRAAEANCRTLSWLAVTGTGKNRQAAAGTPSA